MANDLDLEPPPLADVLTYGAQNKLAPDVQAKAVLKWRDDARSFGEQKYAEDEPNKFFKGNAALDKDVQGALDGLKQQAGPQAANNPLFQAPQSSEDFQPLVAASGKQVGSFQAQPGVKGNMDVLVHVTNPKGDDPAPTLIKVPQVTDDAVQKARTAAQDELDANTEESRGTDSASVLGAALGFEPSGTVQNVTDKQRDLELRVQQLAGPNAKGILQGEAISNAFQASPTGKKFEEWHPGEDLAKGFLRFGLGAQYAIQQATGGQSDLTGLSEGPVTADTTRQAIGALDQAIPGTVTTNPAMKVLKGATETLGGMPMVLNPGGSAVMAVSAYGDSVATAQIGAEAADKQADALKKANPDLSKKFSDLATRMRDDAQLEGGLRGVTMGALLELIPDAKSFQGNIAKESTTWGGIAAANDQFNQKFKGTQPDPMSVLDGIVAGAALGTARGMLPSRKPATAAPDQTPPTSTQGGPPPADDWTSATAGTGPEQPPPDTTGQSGGQSSGQNQGQQAQPEGTNGGQSTGQNAPPEPQPAGPPPRQPATSFNTQAEFNVYMDQAVQSGDVEGARDAFSVNADRWRKEWVKTRNSKDNEHRDFIQSIFTNRSNAAHAAQSQTDAAKAGAGTPPGNRGAAGARPASGNAPEARPAEPTPEPEPVTPNESIPRPTDQSPGSPPSSPQEQGSPPADAELRNENNAPPDAQVPEQQAGSDGGVIPQGELAKVHGEAGASATRATDIPSAVSVGSFKGTGFREKGSQKSGQIGAGTFYYASKKAADQAGIESPDPAFFGKKRPLFSKYQTEPVKFDNALQAYGGTRHLAAWLMPEKYGDLDHTPSMAEASAMDQDVAREVSRRGYDGVLYLNPLGNIIEIQDLRNVPKPEPAPPTAASSAETPSAPAESQPSQAQSTNQGDQSQKSSAAPTAGRTPRKKPFSIRKKKGEAAPEPVVVQPEPSPEASEPAPAPPKAAASGSVPHELQEPNDKFLKHPVIGPTYAAKTQRAVDEGRPVNAAMAKATGVELPDGYQVGADGIARPRPTEAVIREALNLGDPVAASDLDRYGIPLPHDYYVAPDGTARHGNDWTEATDGQIGGDAGNPPPPTSGSETDEPFYSGIPIPAPRLRRMSSLDKATTGWSFKLQKSFQEARRAASAIEKVAKTEPQRAAMSLYVEAGGDMGKLGRWATAQPRPQVIAAGGKKFQKVLDAFRQAARDAMSLTPEQIAVAQRVRQTFDVLHTRGTRAGIINAFRDNYIPHIWNLDGGPGGGASGRRLQKSFRFSKARTFDTTFDGVMEGMMPKTLDIAKTLPAYMHEMNSVIADRQFVQDLDAKFADDGRPLVIPRGNVKEIVGDQSDKAYMIAPRKWDDGARDKDGNKFDQRDYKVMENQPALSDWLFKGSDSDGNPMFMNSDLAVHPDTYRRVNAMMGNSKIRRWYNSPSSTWASPIPKALVKAYDKTQSVMKREMFSFYAPFHQVQEGTHAIGHTVNPFSGLLPVDLRQPGPADAARHGLMLMPDKASMHQYLEGVGSGQTWLSKGLKALHIPGLDKTHALAWLGKGAEAYQDYLFHSYIPRLKYTTYEHALARARKDFADMINRGEATEDDVKMLVAHYVNSAFGHLNYALMDRSPTIQHFLQMGLLSPDFTWGRALFAGQAVKGLDARNPVGKEQLRAMAVLAAIMAGGAFTLAQVFGGKWDYKDPFAVTFGNRKFSMRSVPEDVMRFINDTRNQMPTWLGGNSRRTGNEFVTARINPTLQTVQQAVEGLNFRGEKVKIQDTMAEALGKFLPITLRQIPGLSSLTDSTHSSPVPPLQQFIGSLGIKASRFSPITGAYELANEWKTKTGVPSDYKGTYPVSQYQQLRYAIEDGDIPKAASEYKELLKKEKPDKLAKGFAVSVNHPFTGSKANDAKFRASLTGDDRAVYDTAVDRRKMIMNTFPKVREEANRKP